MTPRSPSSAGGDVPHTRLSLLAAAALFSMTGCPSETPTDDDDSAAWCSTDADGDGFLALHCAGLDCADDDPAVHPDATEVCGDGVDNNCDGGPAGCGLSGVVAPDDADVVLRETGSSYQFGISLAAGPDGTGVGPAALYVSSRPDIMVVTYDDVGEGEPSSTYTDGTPPLHSLVQYPRWMDWLPGAEPLLVIGDSSVTGGDLGDLGSLVELVEPASGATSIPDARRAMIELATDDSVPLPIFGECGPPYSSVLEPGGWSFNRAQVRTCGDLTGDGLEDLCLGAHGTPLSWWTGGAWVFDPWTLPKVASLADAAVEILGSRQCGEYGYRLSGGMDLTGDGDDDLAVGGLLSGPANVSLLTVFAGPLAGSMSQDDAASTISEAAVHGRFTSDVVELFDLNADGVGDLLVSAIERNTAGVWNTILLGFLGPFDGDRTSASSDLQIRPRSDGHNSLTNVTSAGDVDGDGVDDLLVSLGTTGPDSILAVASGACLFYGPITGPIRADDADFCVLADTPDDRFGQSIVGGADFNGDGLADFAVGAPLVAQPEGGRGAVYVFYGRPRLL